MGGGLLQLVAYGAQDIYLTGNPQITFFKVVYRRHTNFAMEAIENVFNGTPGFGKRVTCQISRNGDLIHRMYIQVKLPNLVGQSKWVDYIGQRLLLDVEIEIGGQRIDKHYSYWLYIWNELALPVGKQPAYKKMVGAQPNYGTFGPAAGQTGYFGNILGSGGSLAYNASASTTQGQGLAAQFMGLDVLGQNYLYGYSNLIGSNVSGLVTGSGGNAGNSVENVFVPLEFWFNRNVGLALPLIALQYHEVKINIDFETLANCLMYSNSANPGFGTNGSVAGEIYQASIWVDYIYLDTDERRRFAQLSHEYLIEQLQWTGDETITYSTNNTTSYRYKMNFNHPTKEVIWAFQRDCVTTLTNSNNWINFASEGPVNPIPDMYTYNWGNLNTIDETQGTNIQLNGQDRFYMREGTYFNLVQPYQHHENTGGNPGINVYSFALKPEEHQPSGTLNFSRIDTAYLNLKLAPMYTPTGQSPTGKIKVFAVNYNVLRIMSGMGGLAYSN
jgi:hypothetical protein